MYQRSNLQSLLKAKSYKKADLKNASVLVRACLNVPLKNGKITDKTRVEKALPLIKELSKVAKKVVIIGHLGRPDGFDPDYSLKPVQKFLEGSLKEKVILLDKPEIPKEIADDYAEDKRLFLLENIRFFNGEQSKDIDEQTAFAKKLASLGDIFINDAFPDYRESASTYYLAKELPSFIGPAFFNEIQALSNFTEPKPPFTALFGGGKVESKLKSILGIIDRVDKIMIGGLLAYTIFKAAGIKTGNSIIYEDALELAREIYKKYHEKLILPIDHIVVDEFNKPWEPNSQPPNSYTIISSQSIPTGKWAVDIGPKTVELFQNEIGRSQTILWNGPLGVLEWDIHGSETRDVARAIASNAKAYSLVGGGDSIAAINKFQVKGFNHISTGGGAMLAFLAYDSFSTLDVILDQL